MNGLAKSVRVALLGLLDGVQQAEDLALARGGRHVIDDILVEYDEAGGVALRVGHVAERRRHEARVIELGDRVRAVPHGSRGIEQHE